jgi:hypothetical protein
MSGSPETGPENSSEDLHACPNPECWESRVYIAAEELTVGTIEEVTFCCDNCQHERTLYLDIDTVDNFKKQQKKIHKPLTEQDATLMESANVQKLTEYFYQELFPQPPEDLDKAA